MTRQEDRFTPIVLDLNGNGFSFDSTDDSKAFYDVEDTDERRLLAWSSGNDAFLAYDANDDGKISGKNELSLSGYVSGAQSDLQGLAFFDTNEDGKFSAADDEWSSFYAWKDMNGDGEQQATELYTLGQLGIASISLTSDGITRGVEDVTVYGIGTFTRIDGSQGDLADTALAYTDEVYTAEPNDDVTLVVNGDVGGVAATGTGDDNVQGSSGIDAVDAGSGDDWLDGGAGADYLDGGSGNDRVKGGADNDLLLGRDGDDVLFGGDGNDILFGGWGSDMLDGGTGQDTYVFRLGDGNDMLVDVGTSGQVSRILLGAGITPASLQGAHGESSRILYFSATDSIEFAGLSATTGNVELVFSDGSTWNTAQVLAATNNAPTLERELLDRTAKQGRAFSMGLPLGMFADDDQGETLTVTAKLANGSPLPAWLTFNATTGVLSGTPAAGDVGTLSIQVIATDSEGSSVADQFALTVEANATPIAAYTLIDRTVAKNTLFSYTIPADAFADADVDDALTLTVKLANGNPLPSWLTYNATTRTISGSPGVAQIGELDLRVTATDKYGAAVTSDFTLSVINRVPVAAAAELEDQEAQEDEEFSFTIPQGTFTDADAGDTLTLSATLADGSALPEWLSFNAQTRTLSGTPLNDDVGSLDIKFTATDPLGATVTSLLTISVANTNHSPELMVPVENQTISSGEEWIFALDPETYVDADVGDVITYAARLENGDPLPSWLTFNAQTLTFSGTPTAGDAGVMTIALSAEDEDGYSDETYFDLTVQAQENSAPVVAQPLVAQSATEDAAFNFTVPVETFTDSDEDDTLTLSATLADGNALPSWLSFNAATRTFSGTPTNANVGSLSLKVIATDEAGATASSTFSVTIANVNDAPTVSTPLTAQSATENAAWSYVVPSGTFTDVDTGDALTYSATLANGSALPSWLSFNAATRTFSGNPAHGDIGSLSLKVTATDNAGATASSTFALTVGAASNPGQTFTGTSGNDTLTGTAGDDTLYGLDGHDTLNGGDGNDTIVGGLGDDTMSGGNGDDTFLVSGTNSESNRFQGDDGYDVVLGSAGDDLIRLRGDYTGIYTVEKIDGGGGTNILTGDASHNILDFSGTELVNITRIEGGTGNDTITGSSGNDIIVGGVGDDTLIGGAGDDTFLVGGILPEADRFQGGSGYDVVLGSAGDDTLQLLEYQGVYTVEKIDGGLGTNVLSGTPFGNVIDLSGTELVNIARIEGGGGNDTITGSAGNDIIVGGADADRLIGGDGDDTFLIVGSDAGTDRIEGSAGYDIILGSAGDDVFRFHSYQGIDTVEKIDGGLGTNVVAGGIDHDIIDLSTTELVNIARIEGGIGDDFITGSAGNDVISGGGMADRLAGGLGNDTYLMARGYGSDTIEENDATSGNSDMALFDAGIATDQLWFSQVGNNLEVSIIGTADKFTVKNWYLGSQYHVEKFKTSDGKVLLDSQVQNLVQAMAAFSPPAAGQTTLPTNYANTLNPTIAANWQ
jgi:Ca2+-binding RTX toxin-like protein